MSCSNNCISYMKGGSMRCLIELRIEGIAGDEIYVCLFVFCLCPASPVTVHASLCVRKM